MKTTKRIAGINGHVLRLIIGISVIFSGLFLNSCDTDDPVVVDMTPPVVPTGVFTITGDAVVSVYWNDLYDEDLIGYDVYRHDGNDPIHGEYNYLGTVGWDENLLDGDLLHWFDDYSVTNGQTYFYAVLSFDEAGNESYLSFEIVIDTPRPEGYEVLLYDDNIDPLQSGFDFSRLQLGVQPGNAVDTDIMISFTAGIPYVSSARPLKVEIQDYGTQNLINVDYAPLTGYSAAGRLELIIDHCYIVRITESAQIVNYAKFQVTDMGLQAIQIDWAYQTDYMNQELSLPIDDIHTPAPGHRQGRNDIVRF